MRSDSFWVWFESHCVPRLSSGGATMSRVRTFRAMFEHLDKVTGPVRIVETGCIEDPENWVGNGCSTIMFDRYVESHPGSSFYSVDIDPVHVEIARAACTSKRTVIVLGDSIAQLGVWARLGAFDLLYLDASHLDWNNEVPAQAHHLQELYAAMPAIRDQTLVAVDDSPPLLDEYPRIFVGGKGGFVFRHAIAVGADLAFCEYQAGWTKMNKRPDHNLDDIRDLVRRAREHVDAGRLVQADPIYRLILVLTGKPPLKGIDVLAKAEASVFYAHNAMDKGKWGLALDWLYDALSANPRDIDARLTVVRVARKLGMHDVARAEAERATRIDPKDHLCWKALGDCEHVLADRDEKDRGNRVAACIAAYDKEAELAPKDYIDWKLDRCAIAIDTEDYARAEQLCDEMTGTANEKDAWHVRGMIMYRLGRHEQAIECFDKAIAMKARDLPQVHWNKSLALHSIGRYREGWQEHEWRAYATHQAALGVPMRRFVLPKWNGQAAPAIIHVHGEAGAGDNIACARYLKLMAEDGYTVRYECLGTMEKLFRDSLPEVEVVERAADYPGGCGIAPFDYHAPIGSLPAIFKTDLDTVPWPGPYIAADPELVAGFEKQLVRQQNGQHGRRIGFAWSSGIRLNEGVWMERYGRKKSMRYDQLMDVIYSREVGDTLVSLQVGPERAENRGDLLDLLSEKPDWAETAALVACLDLVITVDTGVAHLAGAMGKPLWVLMHTEGSWHFMVERPGFAWNERSPWYPSARIFRAKRPGEWGPVVERVAGALAEADDLLAAE